MKALDRLSKLAEVTKNEDDLKKWTTEKEKLSKTPK